MNKQVRIGVTFGLRGYFAVMYDDDGPIQTSPISCKTFDAAVADAKTWAQSEGLEYDGDRCSRINDALRRLGEEHETDECC
jgi:hypothetical protein